VSKKTEQAHTLLEGEKKRIEDELTQLGLDAQSNDVRREGSPFGKREEEATESLEFEKRLALEKQLNEQKAEVEHALKKIEDGTYGLCDSCGQPIAENRLEALPQASLCIECKAKNAKPRV
jgi:RNA polymerase-binding protein DksA